MERVRKDANYKLEDAAFEERIIGIEKATAALCEVINEDKIIISLLQKYWDLRFSEANEFLQYERSIKRGS